MTNLTEKYITHIKTLREEKEVFDADDKAIALAKIIKHEKGIGDLALTVAWYIVDDGMSYEEALAEAMKDEE